MEASHDLPVILIVEDELFIRMMAVDILSDMSMAVVVHEAGCAEEALQVLRCHSNISLLFTDIDMPGEMNGLALAALVHEQWPETALIVTSGGRLLGNGEVPDAGTFLSKPYRASELEILVHEKLAQHGVKTGRF